MPDLATIAWPAGVGAFLALALCLLRMPIARTMALVDVPDHPRKIHIGPVPLIGGIALFPAIAIANIQAVSLGARDDAMGVVVGVVFGFFMIGYADDRMQIRPSRRLLLTLTLFAALVLMAPGFMPADFQIGGAVAHLGSGMIALLAIIGATGALNAINMADGQDGLCCGLLAIWLAAIATVGGEPVAAAALIVALSLLVVMAFNLVGLVFLGDMGAYGGGSFVLALMLYAAGAGMLDHGQIVALLIVPVADCILLMIERARRGKSPYDPDRQHLHHILRVTFGAWPALLIYLAVVALCAIAALANGPIVFLAITGGILLVLLVRQFGRREPELVAPADEEILI